jgi:hypothetical protein
MDIQKILIFALIGAVALFVITGGMSSMMDTDADATTLGAGAAIGGLMGAGAAAFGDFQGAESMLKPLLKGGSREAELKVGLPSF